MNPDYTPYHPKWHRRRMPIFWWLGSGPYIRFITRELTSLFVAYAAVLLLAQLWILSRGPAAYERFLEWLASPAVLVAHAVVWLALLFHTVTWLWLAPKALVVQLRGRRVPNALVAAVHYGAWVIASGLVAWFVMGGAP